MSSLDSCFPGGHGVVRFESLRVPASDVLGEVGKGFKYAQVRLSPARLTHCMRWLGAARRAHDVATEYARKRTAFGKPISHFQGLAFLLADMATRVEVMDGLMHRAAWDLDRGSDALAPFAIAECHEGAIWVTNHAVQVLGGAGFVTDHPVEKWMRDAQAHQSFGVPSALADLIAGRAALEGTPLSMEEDAPMPGLESVVV